MLPLWRGLIWWGGGGGVDCGAAGPSLFCGNAIPSRAEVETRETVARVSG